MSRGSRLPRSYGKPGPDFMENAVYSNLGSKSRTVLVGPGRGYDNAVLRVNRKKVMIVTVDPVSAVPELGISLSAWLSVHLIASDFATSGRRPEFATFSYNFPPSLGPSGTEEYIRAVGRECGKLGVTIIGGHTGSYPGGGFTVIGAGSMFGFCGEREYVTPGMAREGDVVMLTKSAGIEAAAYLVLSFPHFAKKRVGDSAASWAKVMIKQCSTVADALTAAEVGLARDGVTSMHDATEGGVLGALAEMAFASGRAFVVKEDAIPVADEARSACSAFGLDPLTSLSEGALLVTCRPERAAELGARMRDSRIGITEVGRVKEGTGLWVSQGKRPPRLRTRIVDGYWDAYARSVAMDSTDGHSEFRGP